MARNRTQYMVVFNVNYSDFNIAYKTAKAVHRKSGYVFDIINLSNDEFEKLRNCVVHSVTDRGLIESKPWWHGLTC